MLCSASFDNVLVVVDQLTRMAHFLAIRKGKHRKRKFRENAVGKGFPTTFNLDL
jgi:hypothetical protein